MDISLLTGGILLAQLAAILTFLVLIFKSKNKNQKESHFIEEQKQQLLKLEGQNRLLRDQEAKAKASHKRIEKEMESLKKKNSELNEEFFAHKKAAEANAKEVGHLKKENAKLTAELKNRQNSLSEEQKEQLAKIESQNKSLRDEEIRLRIDNEMLKKELDSLVKKKSELNDQLLERKRLSAVDAIEIGRLKKENSELAIRLKESEQVKPKEEPAQEPTVLPEKEEIIEPAIKKEENKPVIRRHRQLSREQKKKKLGEILLEQGLVTTEALNKALVYQEKTGYNISQYLLGYGYIDQAQLAQCLCTQFSIPYIPLHSYNIPGEIIQLVPVTIAEKYWLIPVEKTGNFLMVAMADPFDNKAIKQVEELTGCVVQPFVSILSEIMDALEVYYKVTLKEKDEKGRIAAPFFVDSEAYKGPERRDSIRFTAALDISYPIKNLYKTSKTKDVSRSGFLFDSEIPLSIGSLITLQINLPREIDLLPIAAIVQVVRIIAVENQKFEVGVKMIKISKQELDIIMDYAASLETAESS